MSIADAERGSDGDDRHRIRRQIEMPRLPRAHRFLWMGSQPFLAGDDMDADVAGPTHQIVHHRAVEHFEPLASGSICR